MIEKGELIFDESARNEIMEFKRRTKRIEILFIMFFSFLAFFPQFIVGITLGWKEAGPLLLFLTPACMIWIFFIISSLLSIRDFKIYENGVTTDILGVIKPFKKNSEEFHPFSEIEVVYLNPKQPNITFRCKKGLIPIFLIRKEEIFDFEKFVEILSSKVKVINKDFEPTFGKIDLKSKFRKTSKQSKIYRKE